MHRAKASPARPWAPTKTWTRCWQISRPRHLHGGISRRRRAASGLIFSDMAQLLTLWASERQSVCAQGAAAEVAALAAAPEEAAAGAEAAAAPIAADSRDAAAAEPPAVAREKGEDAGMDGKVCKSAITWVGKQATSEKKLLLCCVLASAESFAAVLARVHCGRVSHVT